MCHLLVSFPNVFPYGLALGTYDFESGNFRWVDVAGADRDLLGVDGICRRGDGYWMLTQLDFGGISGLAELDLALRPKRQYRLAETRDAHSMIADGSGFLVTDTGRNRLNRVCVGADGRVREEEVWRACPADEDLVHLNSVARLEGDLYVSHLGPRPEEGWSRARDGKIVNITRDDVVCDGLCHPHTLTAHEGTLYWLESGRSRLHRYSPQTGHEVFLELGGYLRGMAFDDQFLYVGASALRRRSRSTGAANVYPSAGVDESHSWLYRVDRATLGVTRRKMTAFGAEIYDLVRAEPSVPKPCAADLEEAVVDRMWKYEDVYRERVDQHQEQVRYWEREVAALQGRVGDLEGQVTRWQEQVSDLQRQTSALREEGSSSEGQVYELRNELERVYNCRRWRLMGQALRPLERLGLLGRQPAQKEDVLSTR